MASLQGIKSRIHSIESIKKITHAMELVSASKMRRARKDFDNINSYNNLILEAFDALLAHLSHEEILAYFPEHLDRPKLYIIFSSDLGLAGSYNSNVIKLAKKTINKNDKLILVGLKAINAFYHEFKDKDVMTLASDSSKENNNISLDIMHAVYDKYQKNEIGSVNVIYNKYINNLVQEAIVERIYPFDIKDIEAHKAKNALASQVMVEFEPSLQNVLAEAIPLYLNSRIYFAYASAKLSEMASRRSAMETATDNANNLINDLNLQYNRRRQSNITQEISEIVAGADAI